MERILIIADCLDVCSPTGDAALLAEAKIKKGCDVEVWQTGNREFESKLPDAISIRWPNRYCSQTVSTVRRRSREFQPTSIYCFGSNAMTAGTLCRRRKNSRLLAVHASGRQLVDGHMSWKRTWQLSQFDRHLVSHESVLDDVRLRFPAWNVDVFPRLQRQPVLADKDSFRKELQIPQDAKLVTSCAPLTTHSRLKDFIWACDLVTCIRDDIYWLIIGEGDLRWRLQRFQGFLEIGNHLRYGDWSQRSEQWIAASDIYVQTSSAYESSCGIATALSNGVPCIVSKEAAHSELVVHGINGYQVERSARNEFARCVNRLANEPAIASRFSINAASSVKRNLVEPGNWLIASTRASESSAA